IVICRVQTTDKTFEKIKTGGFKKGDVLGTAQIAAIMGAKKTSEIIPMCHPIMINGVDVNFQMIEEDLAIALTAEVKCGGVTGVEMEALTAVSIGLLTIYDMCKAVQKDMVIEDIKLLKKTGGKSGTYQWEDKHE
ncbi:MAG: cyclic pyranopterin monophosphate synthase MoaC, partial [Anaerovoracaceae bacterium]